MTDLTYIRPDGIPILCLSYFASYITGEVKLNEEATRFAWITADKAEEYDFIDGISGEIKEVDKILKERKVS